MAAQQPARSGLASGRARPGIRPFAQPPAVGAGVAFAVAAVRGLRASEVAIDLRRDVAGLDRLDRDRLPLPGCRSRSRPSSRPPRCASGTGRGSPWPGRARRRRGRPGRSRPRAPGSGAAAPGGARCWRRARSPATRTFSSFWIAAASDAVRASRSFFLPSSRSLAVAEVVEGEPQVVLDLGRE